MPAIELEAADGHRLAAYRAVPDGAPRGGLIVVQEIFGVNRHIRSVADRFASEGYDAIAPAIFDRLERGVELGYDEAGIHRGRAIAFALTPEQMMLDLGAALAALRPAGKVGTVGYCFGGTVAWLAAARLDGLAAAVSYYGSRIVQCADEAPRVPLMMHVGRLDQSFPMTAVEEIAARHPSVQVHAYDADHGFNCDDRGSYDASAAAEALARTLDFLRATVG